MTAAAERAQLAAIGRDLARLAGDAGTRRAQALLGRRPTGPGASFADLAGAPTWLRRHREELTRLARAAALVAIGPAVAASIDGAWLGELAERAGETALDRAIAAAPRVPGGGVASQPTAALDGLGFDLMRAALPSALRRYLDWAPRGSVPASAALGAFCIDVAEAR